MKSEHEIKDILRAEYGSAARNAAHGKPSCCGTGNLLESDCLDPITSNLYRPDERAELPTEAVPASFGCGNPTALAMLRCSAITAVFHFHLRLPVNDFARSVIASPVSEHSSDGSQTYFGWPGHKSLLEVSTPNSL